jgi:hypothetical protein
VAGMSTLSNIASELENLSRLPVAPAISLRHLATEIRGSQYYNREQVIACSQEAAKEIYEHLVACSVLPPEFKGDYLMQSRLIAGLAKRIEAKFMPTR